MLLALVYRPVCWLLRVALGRNPAARAEMVELLALRHEVRVLRRQVDLDLAAEGLPAPGGAQPLRAPGRALALSRAARDPAPLAPRARPAQVGRLRRTPRPGPAAGSVGWAHAGRQGGQGEPHVGLRR
jgi:hypothetical protein